MALHAQSMVTEAIPANVSNIQSFISVPSIFLFSIIYNAGGPFWLAVKTAETKKPPPARFTIMSIAMPRRTNPPPAVRLTVFLKC
jgi:hypothetical protein